MSVLNDNCLVLGTCDLFCIIWICGNFRCLTTTFDCALTGISGSFLVTCSVTIGSLPTFVKFSSILELLDLIGLEKTLMVFEELLGELEYILFKKKEIFEIYRISAQNMYSKWNYT